MSRLEFSKEEIDKICHLYQNERIGIRSIGNIFGCSESPIKRILKENNIHLRTVQESNSKQFSEEDIADIVKSYVIDKIGTYTLAKKYNCSEKAIQTCLKHKGIKLRTYVESKQEGRKYQVNDNFFKTQTPDMAYILGLIASDGNISSKENALHIQLRDYDGEILEQIKEKLSSTRPIDYYTDSKGISYAKLSIWSASIKQDLAKYNIVPNKTFILQPPTFLEKSLWIDYIRGYFDGDGSVSQCGRVCSWNVEGASKPLIEWIREVLANEYGITNNKLYLKRTEKGNIIYVTNYYGSICNKIFEILYKPNTLFLKRKYTKFVELICPRGSDSSVEE